MSNELNRRDFMRISAIPMAMLAAGKLPLLEAGTRKKRKMAIPAGQGVDGHLGPYATKPILAYRDKFAMANGHVKENYTLNYKVLRWSSPKKPGASKITPFGDIKISRTAKGNKAQFDISQSISSYGRVFNKLDAQIVCSASTPISWNLHSHVTGKLADKQTSLRETGTVRNGAIVIDNGTYKTQLKATNPVTTQWTILDELMRSQANKINKKIDFLQDLEVWKPGHDLLYDGEVKLTLSGTTVTLASVVQRGYGINPIHYLIDNQGHVQLMTNGIVSWALESIE